MAKNREDRFDEEDPELPRLCNPGEVMELFMEALRCSKNAYYKYYYPFLTWRRYHHDGYPKIPYREVIQYIKQAINNPVEEFRYMDK